MPYIKKSNWKFDQNSWTYWYTCPTCGYGAYDGWSGNQNEPEYCPKCHRHMYYTKPLLCSECPKNTATMCVHKAMENPFEEIGASGCRKGCPILFEKSWEQSQ